MYKQQELDSIDNNYFYIIMMNEYSVTLISKNTFHMWKLHNVELQDGEITVIFHKHHVSDQYHRHGRSSTLCNAIRQIKAHDAFQLNGRKPVRRH